MKLKNVLTGILIISTLSFSFGQNPPAEVGQNNIIWLEANDLSGPLSDGFTWADKSGNGFDASEISDGVNTPTLVTVGSQQYLRFAGLSGEQLIIPDDNATTNLLDGSSKFSVITVFNTGATDTRAIISKRLNSGSGSRSWTMFYNTGFDMFGYAGATTVGGSGSVAAAGNPYIATMTVDASLTGGSVKMFVNTDAEGSTGSNISIPDRSEDVYIGLFNSGDTRYFDGDIAEIIVYRDALNGGERLILENYLAQKYGIAISNDFFGNDADYVATYDDDIRGIGTADGVLKQSTSGFSSALRLNELTASLDAINEFVMFAHDASVAHADNITSSLGEVEITDRWQKDYYLEFNQNGTVDNASVNTEFVFDFSEAGLPFSGSASDYVLLYRASTSDNFTRVFANSYTIQNGDQVVIDVSSSRLSSGYYTLGRGDQLVSRTWYLLQNGNWIDPTTWTLDAGVFPIPNNPFNEIPGPEDNVIVRSGKTLTIQSTTNNLSLGSIVVDGILNVGTSSGHNFTTIEGNGRIIISGSGGVSNFPAGTTTTSNGFGDDVNGGLLVVVGTGLEFDQPQTFNDVRIELDNPTDIASIGEDLTLNGNLTVRFGTLRFGDGTTNNRTLTVFGDLLVENNGFSQIGSITTANANARHEFNLHGDFINEGKVSFTQRTSPNYVNEATNGIVDLNLVSPTQNQLIDLRDTCNFYRIEINKGTDATYIAAFQAGDASYFNLFGPANDNLDNDIVSTDILNANGNAFALITGTAKIGANINIPVLNRNGNYCIGSNGRLWIDGGNVTKNIATAIVPYGILEISNGSLTATGNSGITLRINGLLKVDGGTVTTNNIRTSVQGPQSLGGYQQSGGDVVLDGNIGAGSANGNYYIMSLTYVGNVFLMSGGTLTVRDPNGRGAIFINSDPGNISVTGGELIMESNNANAFRITSRAPFYNVRMRALSGSVGNFLLEGGTSGSGGAARTLSGQPLEVKNDLIVEGHSDTDFTQFNNPFGNFAATLEAVTSTANRNDVIVGGSFYVGANSTYIGRVGTDYNWTVFNQTAGTDSIDYFHWGKDAAFALDLGNLRLDRTTGNQLRMNSTGATNGNIRFRIRGDLEVLSGTLDQAALTVQSFGNVKNFDRLGTWFTSGSYPVAGGTPEGAQVRMLPGGSETIEIQDGAIFGNVQINAGITAAIDFDGNVVIERFDFQEGIIYIGTNNLRIDDLHSIGRNNMNNADAAASTEMFIESPAVSDFLRVVDSGRYDNGADAQRAMIITDGNASDGGLSLKVERNTDPVFGNFQDIYDNKTQLTFPLAFTTTPGSPDFVGGGINTYYRPAQVKISNYADDGYITIRPVSGELQTTDLTGGEILQNFWRVTHSDFSSLPTVAYRFYYRNRNESGIVDLDAGAVNESSYVPGSVLDGGSYTRSYESDSNTEEDNNGIVNGPVDPDTRTIIFNGDNVGTNDDDLFGFSADAPGFTLENANYTAGVSTRFIGAPQIFYSRLPNNSSWYNRNWADGNHWSFVPHDGATNNSARPAAGTWPQAGDIAVIGFGGFTGGISPRHSLGINNGDNITVAEIQYNHPGNNGNRLVIYRNGTLTFGKIGGTGGTFMERPNAGDAASITGDFGDFYTTNTFTYSYYLNTNGTYNITPPTVTFPNLRVEGGNNSRIAIFQNDITVNNNMTVDGNTVVLTNNGAEGDITVLGDLRIGGYLGGNFQFNNGTDRTVEVGRLWLRNQGTCNMEVLNTIPSGRIHRLIVNGDILQQRPGIIDLFNGTGALDNNVILELKGTGNHSYTKTNGSTADFYQIVMNKGSDTTSSFAISEEFNIPDATSTFQPLEMLNGKLIIDNANINAGTGMVLASGSDFFVPNTNNPEALSGSAGIELRQGILLMEGDDTGLILDAKLTIAGGTFDMASGAGNGNNFIEYSSTGNAAIEISSGTLEVGSQIRRGLTATTGLLSWTQSGGTVRVGVNTAPQSTRGVFEVLNSGSSFTHTGGDFTLVRQNGSGTVASLILKPDPSDANITGSTITIGDGSTPPGQNNIGIDATVTLNTLLVTGSSSLTAKTYNNPLNVNNLSIQSSGTFDANGLGLSINNDLLNDGDFVSGGNSTNDQTTTFPSNAGQQISGTGTTAFYNLVKSGTGTLTVAKDITVNRQLNLFNGIISSGTSAINAKGDVINDSEMQSAFAGPGLVFNGNEAQNLLRSGLGTSRFGTITIDNQSGVELPLFGTDFRIDNKVILSSGQFNIGFNLLIMEENAFFENGTGGTAIGDFTTQNMVTVNTSIVDKGISKIFNDSYTGTFVFPIGLSFYTPVESIVDNITSSPVNSGFITVKPINGVSAGIVEDDDETCPDVATTDFVDEDNVLQYFWLIKSGNITDYDGAFSMYHDDALESIGAIAAPDYTLANYAPARLLENTNTWDKNYGEALFDEVSNRIDFKVNPSTNFTNLTSDDIEGNYTAGITRDNVDNPICGGAIPDVVPVYVTIPNSATGDITDLSSFAIAPGGTPPGLGESPDLIVDGNFELNLTNQFWRFRKVELRSGATLSITGAGVNLGSVEGEGTIKLIDNSNFPAGDYDEFFPDVTCGGGGGVEYEVNSGSQTVLSGISNVRRVIVSGNGEKVMAGAQNTNICENLEIRDNGIFRLNDDITLSVKGNIIKESTAAFDGDYSNTQITLDGSSLQVINGQFTGTEAFQSLEIDNPVGISIIEANDFDVEVEESFTMTNGLVRTDADNDLTLLNGVTLSGNYSNTTFVNGPLKRELQSAISSFEFPVGRSGQYFPLDVVNPAYASGGPTKIWTTEFLNTNPQTTPLITNANDSVDFSTFNGEIANINSRISGRELWLVDVASPATSKVRISWNSQTNVGAGQTEWEFLRVLGWDDTDEVWESYGNGNVSGDYTGATVDFGQVVSSNDFSYSTNFITWGSINSSTTVFNALPVELIDFEARREGQSSLLFWSTATETNSSHFEIERMENGNSWNPIGRVEASGYSRRELNYRFTDEQPLDGFNYYRLKIVDLDGNFEYSKVVNVYFENELKPQPELSIYPNPVLNHQLQFAVEGLESMIEAEIAIFDLMGNIVGRFSQSIFDGTHIQNLPESIKSGVYILRIHSPSGIMKKRFIVN